MYVCRAAVSSKGLSPVFLASKVCSSSSSPMLTCTGKPTLHTTYPMQTISNFQYLCSAWYEHNV